MKRVHIQKKNEDSSLNSFDDLASKKDLISVLSGLLSKTSSKAATDFLISNKTCNTMRRKELALLAGLESAWVNCNQSLKENMIDLVNSIIIELYDPYYYYAQSLKQDHDPIKSFNQSFATKDMKISKKTKFWTTSHGLYKNEWLPSKKSENTIESVVHFIQNGSGTGVHINGHGQILTCAHVIDAHDDEKDENRIPSRIGRYKLIMFPSGRIFMTQCISVIETDDGGVDVALLQIKTEISLREQDSSSSLSLLSSTSSSPSSTLLYQLPYAKLATNEIQSGEDLFCIGNPSNIDLESLSSKNKKLEFEPPTWHTSIGKCQGFYQLGMQKCLITNYNHHDDKDIKNSQRKTITKMKTNKIQGRNKTIKPNIIIQKENAEYIEHSCWTYWGHSGAPLFDVQGCVRGLHCAWDDQTGMRHGQKLKYLHQVVEASSSSSSSFCLPVFRVIFNDRRFFGCASSSS
mmetsp:Transcript_29764/g.38380  ORF Transcript_29764/g.38380 Transcript_29764/m.38380 type:complete len:461 (+) Transcript_29764:52-1434(+)